MVEVRTYPVPKARISEILRYAGAPSGEVELEKMAADCLAELSSGISCRVCFEELDVTVTDSLVTVGNMEIASESFKKYITGCERAIAFAATVGIYPERLIRRYGRTRPARALMLDAAGSELAEALCNAFCDDIKKEAKERGFLSLPRFSPGYGDLPLTLQKNIFALLDCERKIGVTLGDSLLMTPAKSVTAFIGLKNKENYYERYERKNAHG